MLVTHGADINSRSNNGVTPLRDSVLLSQEVVDFLLENGADPDIADNYGKSARDMAPARFEKISDVVVSVPDTEDLEQDAGDALVPEPVAPVPSDEMEVDEPVEPIDATRTPSVEITTPSEPEVSKS